MGHSLYHAMHTHMHCMVKINAANIQIFKYLFAADWPVALVRKSRSDTLNCVKFIYSQNLQLIIFRQTDIHSTASFMTTLISQHQKGKSILGFTEARDDELTVASAGPYANHFHLTPPLKTNSTNYLQMV